MTLAPAVSQLPDPGDGFQISEPLPEGGYVVWTYDAERNA